VLAAFLSLFHFHPFRSLFFPFGKSLRDPFFLPADWRNFYDRVPAATVSFPPPSVPGKVKGNFPSSSSSRLEVGQSGSHSPHIRFGSRARDVASRFFFPSPNPTLHLLFPPGRLYWAASACEKLPRIPFPPHRSGKETALLPLLRSTSPSFFFVQIAFPRPDLPQVREARLRAPFFPPLANFRPSPGAADNLVLFSFSPPEEKQDFFFSSGPSFQNRMKRHSVFPVTFRCPSFFKFLPSCTQLKATDRFSLFFLMENLDPTLLPFPFNRSLQ